MNNSVQLRTGIVGLGYVGGAILHTLKQKNVEFDINTFYATYDIDPSKNPTCASLSALTEWSDIIYIAVPTPMKSNGECDISILDNVIAELSATKGSTKILVIKSTVPPGTTELLQNKYEKHFILFSPEFLTEANYLQDIRNPPVLLVGKPSTVPDWAALMVLDQQFKMVDITWSYQLHTKILSSTEAELYKYVANTFLATKVSFANEISAIAQVLGVDWQNVVEVIKQDSRLGKSHWNVPGPDGHYGYGGTCFPKDLSALLHTASNLKVPTPVLSSVWHRNITIDRPERDWEQLKGRAVSE